jgi:hypothetical protein
MGVSLSGAMLIWPRVVCGSTKCRLAHLVVCVFPSHLATLFFCFFVVLGIGLLDLWYHLNHSPAQLSASLKALFIVFTYFCVPSNLLSFVLF